MHQGEDIVDQGPEEQAGDRRSSRIELISVLVIALTAVATAWSAFESSTWGAEMSVSMNRAGAARTESVRASNRADQQSAVDVGLFSDYVTAVGRGDDELAAFVRDRFPDRLAVATEAWLATDPLNDPDAPGTPFSMAEYRLDATVESDRLAALADDHMAEAMKAGDTSDDYTLTSVMFATVLLFAALASKTTGRRLQLVLLVSACGVLVVTLGIIATFPAKV